MYLGREIRPICELCQRGWLNRGVSAPLQVSTDANMCDDIVAKV